MLFYTEGGGFWNVLPEVVLEVETIVAFKRLLDRNGGKYRLTWHHAQHRHCGLKSLFPCSCVVLFYVHCICQWNGRSTWCNLFETALSGYTAYVVS